MNVIIHPTKLKGSIVVPPSKSLSHRAIIAASLACGRSVISNVMLSKDILATIEGMRALGAQITIVDDKLYIDGSQVKRLRSTIDANESGSTLRFLIPLALVCEEKITFEGKNNLVNRPLDAYYQIFDEQKIKYQKPNDKYLPLTIEGSIKPKTYMLRGDVSSQFITGLLFALPLLKGDSKIVITTPLESKGYIDLTIDILNKFGIIIENRNYEEFIIKGNQSYKRCDYQVEGDYSQVAFFLVADCLGADIKLLGMNKDSYQGDKKILLDIAKMNGKIIFDEALYCQNFTTTSAIIDFSQSPDLGPALTVLASLSKGRSEFINAKRLRIKECDRITCMKEEINKLGGKIIEKPEGMIIDGVDKFIGTTVDSHNDHRVAMALAVASLKTEGDIKILNAECVNKSFPTFWQVFTDLGGKIDYE